MLSLCKESATAGVYWPKPKIPSSLARFQLHEQASKQRALWLLWQAYIARGGKPLFASNILWLQGGILHFALQLNSSAATIASLHEKEE